MAKLLKTQLNRCLDAWRRRRAEAAVAGSARDEHALWLGFADVPRGAALPHERGDATDLPGTT